MKYRREIDGLRAVAVLPIILFHAGFETFSGGFVGVDVFFVISGYLITSIILADINEGTFSITTFYERRIRRILPALFLVMLCSLPFAWLWLLPQHLKDFSESLMAVSTFSSNILFWIESDYFGTTAELKPLLHTWSLAVEEQFYILFPLFLMALWKLGKRSILPLMIVITLVSLTLAQWGAYNNPLATFFLLPMRGWELSIGALIAIHFFNKRKKSELLKPHKAIGEILALLGLSLICYSIFAFNKSTPFPSFYALVPTVGTALIILFATPNTTVGRFLSTKILVGIGLISYSTYLWHQPLFVFARHRSLTEPSSTLLLSLSLISIILAYFSWRFVEMPLRDKQAISRKVVFNFAIIGTFLFAAIGFAGHMGNGFPNRFTADQIKIAEYNNYDYSDFYRYRSCFLERDQSYEEFSSFCFQKNSNNSLMIWGDSNAAALSYGFRMKLDNVTQLTASGCPPIFDLQINERKECQGVSQFAKSVILEQKPKQILLHANWLWYRYAWSVYDKKTLSKHIKDTINTISTLSPNTKIFIIGGVPQWGNGLPERLKNSTIRFDGDRSLPLDDKVLELIVSYDEVLLNSLTGLDVTFISPLDLLCDDKYCPAIIQSDSGYALTAWDYGHLTAEGSSLLASKAIEFYHFK